MHLFAFDKAIIVAVPKVLFADVEDREPAVQTKITALLLTAASSILWLKPLYLEFIVSNLESELLRIERLAEHYSSQALGK